MRISDWSSDVCSSDLVVPPATIPPDGHDEDLGSRRARSDRPRWSAAGGARRTAGRTADGGGAVHVDRKSVVEGTSVSVRVDLGGRRNITKKKSIDKIYDATLQVKNNK